MTFIQSPCCVPLEQLRFASHKQAIGHIASAIVVIGHTTAARRRRERAGRRFREFLTGYCAVMLSV
jgi:hypothetical protein